MLQTNGAKPDISQAITELLKEDNSFDRNENRSAHREHLVRAISIELREFEGPIVAFSRNISATGVGIVTDQPIPDRSVATLNIPRLHGKDVSILAECRWCKTYGENWHLSGWQFINLKR